MAIKLEATEYRVTHRGWVYTAGWNHITKAWTVNRRLVIDAPIPPMTQAFTKKGWVHLFKSEEIGGHKQFSSVAEFSRMIEEQNDG